jgi:hypothetical protein
MFSSYLQVEEISEKIPFSKMILLKFNSIMEMARRQQIIFIGVFEIQSYLYIDPPDELTN